ncbi:hypothetical protein [uncultured Hoeflea sp.]|uniref:hypothetical protein n=1 Tax=uncultured Hoeflea sp. TaxID=538666 RepID=UPI0026330E1B|nr:hypothetical protein [uncultured Hoeflea sp.]
MSETEITGAAPVKWVRNATGTVCVGRARVKGEPRVELVIRDAAGSAQPLLIEPDAAVVLAHRLVAAARAGEPEPDPAPDG